MKPGDKLRDSLTGWGVVVDDIMDDAMLIRWPDGSTELFEVDDPRFVPAQDMDGSSVNTDGVVRATHAEISTDEQGQKHVELKGDK